MVGHEFGEFASTLNACGECLLVQAKNKSYGEFGHVDLVFCFNMLVAMHKFVTERVMLV